VKKNSRAVHISHHNPETLIDSEKSSINANRKSIVGFPTSHQPRSCITLTSQKWGSNTQICRFSLNFDQEPLKVTDTKFHCLKASSGKVVAQSTTY